MGVRPHNPPNRPLPSPSTPPQMVIPSGARDLLLLAPHSSLAPRQLPKSNNPPLPRHPPHLNPHAQLSLSRVWLFRSRYVAASIAPRHSRQSRLESTLTHHPASVDSKPLTLILNPLDATLTKNQGAGPRLFDLCVLCGLCVDSDSLLRLSTLVKVPRNRLPLPSITMIRRRKGGIL